MVVCSRDISFVINVEWEVFFSVSAVPLNCAFVSVFFVLFVFVFAKDSLLCSDCTGNTSHFLELIWIYS